MGLQWFQDQNWRKEWIGDIVDDLTALYDKKKSDLGYNVPPDDPEEVFNRSGAPAVSFFLSISSSFNLTVRCIGTLYG